jgi:hypothetical protein
MLSSFILDFDNFHPTRKPINDRGETPKLHCLLY